MAQQDGAVKIRRNLRNAFFIETNLFAKLSYSKFICMNHLY